MYTVHCEVPMAVLPMLEGDTLTLVREDRLVVSERHVIAVNEYPVDPFPVEMCDLERLFQKENL